MSQYDKLDGKIVESIKEAGGLDFVNLLCNYVGRECCGNRLRPGELLSGRLQSLRKRGLIKYSGGKWRIAPEKEAK